MQICITQPPLREADHDGNLQTISQIAKEIAVQPSRPDFLVLPELFFRESDLQAYTQCVRALAQRTGACVVGGSLHARIPPDEEELFNGGYVVAPDEQLLACYTKAHPYGNEVDLGVMSGDGLCQFVWRDTRCAIVICADMWDSRLLAQLDAPPDILFVVAASVSQEHGPTSARRLWHALAVARAFELTSVVAISDWAVTPMSHARSTCGVSGLADPSDLTGQFHPLAEGTSWHCYTIDLAALKDLRTARRSRNFYFWD